mmetsp:Transcript_4419/g.11033  ORF Transcript_4419/g.11033 Transcript_4419/m.11033 type:complete len:417 (-) Transcript_4419:83-1333(-)
MAGHELMWMDPAEEGDAGASAEDGELLDTETEGERTAKLAVELAGVRKELADVRRELAAKTIQLSKREAKAKEEQDRRVDAAAVPAVDVLALQEEAAAAKAEIARLQRAMEEAEAIQTSQRKSLLEARTHADVATNSAAGEEAARVAYEHHAEFEIDRLNRELASLSSRSNLKLQQKAAEVGRLEAALAAADSKRAEAVAEAQRGVRAEMEAALRGAQHQAAADTKALRSRIMDLQCALEEEQKADNSALLDQLTAAESERLTVTKEFDAFRDMAASAARDKSSEISRLLEENAQLRARMAAQAVNRDFASGIGISMPYDAMDEANQLKLYIEGVMNRRAPWLGQRSLLMLLVGGVLLVLFMFTVLRALASARGPNRWLCALEKLGLTIGDGCLGLNEAHIAELIDEIIEEHPRYL